MNEAEARQRVVSLVSPEAVHRLETFLICLRRWGATHNLIGANEFSRLWERHVLDSLSLLPHAKGSVLDLGSGAGFPGMMLALADPSLSVTLLESNKRKAAFLAYAAAATGVSATVRPVRIETEPARPFATVTARALAPLPRLLALSHRFFDTETVGLFLKGREADKELRDAEQCFAFDARVHPGFVGDTVVVRVTGLAAV